MGLNLDMTLREFLELSERVGAAAQTIRNAQSMLGAPVERTPVVLVDDFGHGPERYVEPPGTSRPAPRSGPVMTNKGPVVLTPEEQARKAQLRAERLAELPDNIRAIEEANPE